MHVDKRNESSPRYAIQADTITLLTSSSSSDTGFYLPPKAFEEDHYYPFAGEYDPTIEEEIIRRREEILNSDTQISGSVIAAGFDPVDSFEYNAPQSFQKIMQSMLRATITNNRALATQAASASKPSKVRPLQLADNVNYDSTPGYMKPTISATVKRTLPVRCRDAGLLRKRGTKS
uniref:ARAD1B22462p n=1 Tax=Blastobotrys adeninivorans TaxID=409370 RepID=A0A060TCB7_BLAAD